MRPTKPTRPPKVTDADRIVAELHSIHIELQKLREAILALPDTAEQQRVESFATRLSKASNALKEETDNGSRLDQPGA